MLMHTSTIYFFSWEGDIRKWILEGEAHEFLKVGQCNGAGTKVYQIW